MHSKRRHIVILLLLVGLAFADSVHAQIQWDFGGMLGGANYLGEMGGKAKSRRGFIADLKLNQTRFAIGGYARYRTSSFLAWNLNAYYAIIAGADSLSTNPGRAGRNLHFKSSIIEISAQGELTMYKNRSYSTRYLLIGSRGRTRYDFNVYTFLGVGGFYFNPKAKYNGSWTALNPLQTEGVKYGLFQVAVPMGFGFYYTIDRKLRVGYETGLRITFTDYLDDVSTVYANPDDLTSDAAKDLANRSAESQIVKDDPKHAIYYNPGEKRGDPKRNDAYMYGVIKVGYALRSKRVSNPKFRSFADLFRKKNSRRHRSRAKFR